MRASVAAPNPFRLLPPIPPIPAIPTFFVVVHLSERGGRLLKLLSGLMMLGLGGVLLIAPHALDRPLTALALVLGAVALTLLAGRWIGPERGELTASP